MADKTTGEPEGNAAGTAPGGALSGLKVLDLSRILGGPLCGQLLGDHGADVIKVEPPQGDDTRKWGPPFRDGSASYFLGVNRNKRAIALDLSRTGGREVLLRLLGDTDILIENFKTGTLEKWGIGYEQTLAKKFPRLIHCRISGFGADGPLGGFPGYDAAIQASAGLMSLNGTPESGPVRIGTPMIDMGAGMNAAIGILAAVHERHASGRGQFVESTLYDAGVSLLHPHAANWFLNARTPELIGSCHPNITPYDKYQTASGEIFLAVGNDRQFALLCAELGKPELADDPDYKTNADRNAHRPALTKELNALLAGKDAGALCDRLLTIGVPAGAVNTLPQVLEHPHTLHREMVVEVDGERHTGVPAKLSRTPGAVRTASPKFGSGTREVLAGAGYSAQDIDALIAGKLVFAEDR